MRFKFLTLFLALTAIAQAQIIFNGNVNEFNFDGTTAHDGIMANGWNSGGGNSSPSSGEWDTDGVKFVNNLAFTEYGDSFNGSSAFAFGTLCDFPVPSVFSCTNPVSGLNGTYAKIIPPNDGVYQMIFKYQNDANNPNAFWQVLPFQWKSYIHNTNSAQTTTVRLKIGLNPNTLVEIASTDDVGLATNALRTFMEDPEYNGFTNIVNPGDDFFVCFEVDGGDPVYLEFCKVGGDNLGLSCEANVVDYSCTPGSKFSNYSTLNLNVDFPNCFECDYECLKEIRVTWDEGGSQEVVETIPYSQTIDSPFPSNGCYLDLTHQMYVGSIEACKLPAATVRVEYIFDSNQQGCSGITGYLPDYVETIPMCAYNLCDEGPGPFDPVPGTGPKRLGGNFQPSSGQLTIIAEEAMNGILLVDRMGNVIENIGALSAGSTTLYVNTNETVLFIQEAGKASVRVEIGQK